MADEYDAFISYSHAADGRLATALRNGLQQFAKPWNRRRAMRVFLDRLSLELTSDLGDALEEKLGGARFLILLASAESAASPWCDQEARFWVESKGPETLMIVLTDSESAIEWDDETGRFDPVRSTALPPSLIEAYDNEPLWLNLAWVEEQGDQNVLDLRSPRFRDAVATLSSAIQGIPKDDLDGEDVAQHNHFRRVRRAAAGALGALAAVALALMFWALKEQSRAEENAAESRSRELASRAEQALADDPGLAVLLAVEAHYPVDETLDHATPEADRALWRALASFATSGFLPVAHLDAVATRIALNPDESMVATSEPQLDGTTAVSLWDVTTGAFIDEVVGPSGIATGLEFGADGQTLLLTGSGKPWVWDLVSQRQHELDDATGPAALLADGRSVLAVEQVGDARFLLLYENSVRAEPRSIPLFTFGNEGPVRYDGGPDPIVAVQPLADGSALLIKERGDVYRWDGNDGVRAVEGVPLVRDVVQHADGLLVVQHRDSADLDGVGEWVLSTTAGRLGRGGAFESVGEGVVDPIAMVPGSMAISSDGRWLAAVEEFDADVLPPIALNYPEPGQRVFVWDLARGTEIGELATNGAVDLVWLTGSRLAVLSSGGVDVFEVREQPRLDVVTALGATSDLSRVVAWDGNTGDIRIWDGDLRVDPRVQPADPYYQEQDVCCFAVPENFAMSGDGGFVVTDGRGGGRWAALDPARPVSGLQLDAPFSSARTGARIAGQHGSELVVIDPTTAATVPVALDVEARVVALSPEGLVAVASSEFQGEPEVALDVVDLALPGESVRLSPAIAAVNTMVFAPEGRRLATGHVDGSVWLWSGEPDDDEWTGTLLDRLLEPVTGISFNSNGELLAAAGADVIVWRVDRRERLFESSSVAGLESRSLAHAVFDLEGERLLVAGVRDTPVFELPGSDLSLACELADFARDQLEAFTGQMSACERVADLRSEP